MDQARANEVALKFIEYSCPELVEQHKGKNGFELLKLRIGKNSDSIKKLLRDLLNSTKAVTPEGSDEGLRREVYRAFLKSMLKGLGDKFMREMSFRDKIRKWWICWKKDITGIEYDELSYWYMLQLVDEVLAESAVAKE